MPVSLAILGSAGIPPRYGGFEILARELADRLPSDFAVTVYCSRRYYKREERSITFLNARLVYIPLKANGFQSIFYDLFSMIHAMTIADIWLILGISGTLFLPLFRFIFRGRIITHMDGLEWERKKWGAAARSFLRLSQDCAVRFSHEIIADNRIIQHYLRKKYGRDPVLAGYGTDHVSRQAAGVKAIQKYPFLDPASRDMKGGYAISVGRIVPENHIMLILESFAILKSRILVVVGNWSASRYGRDLRRKYRNNGNIYLLDPVYDQEEIDMLRSNGYLYIHGHSAGGTNPSLIEAMALGLPVMAHGNPCNIETTGSEAFYFNNKEELVQLLSVTSDEEFTSCGRKMQAIARKQYRWKEVVDAYTRMLSGG